MNRSSNHAGCMVRWLPYWSLLVLLPVPASGQIFSRDAALLQVQQAGSGGVSFIDYDRDGRLDLFFTSFSVLHGDSTPGARLFRNEGIEFREVTGEAGIDVQIGNGIARGDYDGDGWDDLFLTGVGSPNVLLRNRGNGTFEDATARAGVGMEGDGIYRTSASFADVNGDGRLDLFVGNLTGRDRLYLNEGSGVFRDVADSVGLGAAGHTTHHAFGDYDGDGWPDLLVATRNVDLPADATPLDTPLRLYRNLGDGTFEDVTETAGLALPLLPLEAVLFLDADNDGDLDIFITGISHEQPNLYFRNNGDGTFDEVGAEVGLDDPNTFSLGATAADFNNDGWLDVFVATAGPNRLFMNRGDGTFRPAHDDFSSRIAHSFIPAAGTLDGQGAPDLVITNGWSGREGMDGTEVHRNETALGHWLLFELVGGSANRNAIGARIEVVADGLRLVRWVDGGNGYGGGNPLVHVGLGVSDHADSLIVRWPSGALTVETNIAADRTVRIIEPVPTARRPTPAGPNPARFAGTWRTEDGVEFVIARTASRPVWYVPSTGELRVLTPDGALAWRAGPGVLRYEPPVLRIRPEPGDVGHARRLVITPEGGGAMVAARVRDYEVRPVEFASGDVRMSGNLYLPHSTGPHPGVVIVHGSGAQDRYGPLGYYDLVARRFASAGFAALTFDKRGVGASRGEWQTAGFDDLAADVNAAARFLGAREDVREHDIGLWGISQAGWVAARAVQARPQTAFAILVSAAGTALSAAEQNTFNVTSELVLAGVERDLMSRAREAWERLYGLVAAGGGTSVELDSLVTAMRAAGLEEGLLPPQSDEIDWSRRNAWFLALDIFFDPRAAWQAFQGPVHIILGARDASTPSDSVVARLSRMTGEARARWCLTMHPEADHFLLQSPTGSLEELPDLRRFAPDAIEGIIRWAVRVVGVRSATGSAGPSG